MFQNIMSHNRNKYNATVSETHDSLWYDL